MASGRPSLPPGEANAARLTGFSRPGTSEVTGRDVALDAPILGGATPVKSVLLAATLVPTVALAHAVTWLQVLLEYQRDWARKEGY